MSLSAFPGSLRELSLAQITTLVFVPTIPLTFCAFAIVFCVFFFDFVLAFATNVDLILALGLFDLNVGVVEPQPLAALYSDYEAH